MVRLATNLFLDLLLAALLALAFCLCSCAPLPPGLKVAAGFTGSPLGIELRMEQAATYAPQAPAAWVTTSPALSPDPTATSPASQPATPNLALPAILNDINPSHP